jgi:DNA-directed RNA polymerase beta subunit
MPFDGYTYEDGLVVSESLAEAVTISKYKFSEEMFFRSLLPAGEFRRLDQVRFNRLLQDAVKAILDCTNTSLRYGDSLPLDFLGSFFQDQEEQSFFCRYYFHVPSKLSDIRVNAALNRSGRADLVVRFSYTACLPLGFGDKITGRHGNKGVVTHILPDRERPVAMIAGREVPIDLIISPCSILGRKNLGQILEMLHGDLIWGRDQGIPGQYEVPGDRLLTAVEVRDHAIPALRDSLGADDEGHFPVRLSDGRIVRAFAGPQYFIRLHHHCGRKLQARGTDGPVNCLTGHPDRGGVRTAQKMGEMEHWSLLSYPGNGEGLLSSLREKRSPADSAGKMREVFPWPLLPSGSGFGKRGKPLPCAGFPLPTGPAWKQRGIRWRR